MYTIIAEAPDWLRRQMDWVENMLWAAIHVLWQSELSLSAEAIFYARWQKELSTSCLL